MKGLLLIVIVFLGWALLKVLSLPTIPNNRDEE